MAVHTEIKEQSPEPTYPRLMVMPSTGSVLLMTAKRQGTLIARGNAESNILGCYSAGWFEKALRPFVGSVTLSSEAS